MLFSVVKDILLEQGISEQDITFDQFIAILKEVEKRMAHTQSKPNIDELKPPSTTNEETNELVLELDAKVLDFLQ